MKLYPFQEIGVEWLRSRECALLADEMGLGKTVQAVMAARLSLAGKKDPRILIVCPASLKYVWVRTIQAWTNTPESAIQVIKKGTDRLNPDALWTIVNYDLLLNRDLLTQFLHSMYDIGIFDEAHYMKNTTSKRTKVVLNRGGIASRCRVKWFLTGTPILNRPIELYPILKAAAPEVMHPFTTQIGYGKYFCGGYFDAWGGFNARGATHLDELNTRLTKSGFMLRRLKADVLPDLPEKTFEIIPVDITAKSEFAFFWAKDDVSKATFGDYFNADDPGLLGKVATLRQYLAKEKLPQVVSHIKNLLNTKDKIVVFAHHRDVVWELHNALLEFSPVVLLGGMTEAAKNEAETEFQTLPECRVFIGNIKAAGVGITLTAADTVVFAELDWVPGNMMQAGDRVHRIGQKNACLIQMFVTKDSVEEYILRRLVEKKDVCERVLTSVDYLLS